MANELEMKIDELMGLGMHALVKKAQSPQYVNALLSQLESPSTPLKIPTGHGPKVDALVAIVAERAEQLRAARDRGPDPHASELRALSRALLDVLSEFRGPPRPDAC